VEGLAQRFDRLGLVWIDAHGDLNTPETSRSGNAWGMALRMLLDAGAVAPGDAALVAARALDPPEEAFLATSELHHGQYAVERAASGVDAVYVAFDLDAVDSRDAAVFFAEPGGLPLEDAERLLWKTRQLADVAGAGFSGAVDDPRNVDPLMRLAAALGL
jgi:arginase